ncbi:MAG TPA: Gfo/Idh/MocA family oxidoreductase [Planctomycetota bacterium]
MTDSFKRIPSRRQFLERAGRTAGMSALAGVAIPAVHSGADETIRIALVGCGGRGGGAASNALSVDDGAIELVALADVFAEKVENTHKYLVNDFGKRVVAPADRRFVGFDAYKHAMDVLRPGDVVILTTPPAFRWVHFRYAIEKGLNVFMEKPVCVDGPSARRMLKLAAESKRRGLKVGVGLMCRHCEARGEMWQRIQDGAIGDIHTLRAYRMAGTTGFADCLPNPGPLSDLMYQIQRFHGFLWASGGAYSDFLIHNIDECCWMKNAWPVQAQGAGGRHYRGEMVDQNFDTYSVEYTFADGTKLFLGGRTMPGCHQEFASYAQGTQGSAIISTAGHAPSHCRTFTSQAFDESKVSWRFERRERNPYQLEWDHLIAAIRQDLRHHEVERGVEASLVTAMGRMAAHTGRIITRDEMLACEHEFAPGVADLTVDSASPLLADASGRYPVPSPGLVTDREY